MKYIARLLAVTVPAMALGLAAWSPVRAEVKIGIIASAIAPMASSSR